MILVFGAAKVADKGGAWLRATRRLPVTANGCAQLAAFPSLRMSRAVHALSIRMRVGVLNPEFGEDMTKTSPLATADRDALHAQAK